MEASHHSSDLDPSSVLGFGAALPLIESAEEVGRLLTGALRSMGISDLQAVVLPGDTDASAAVVGSMGTAPLPDAVTAELRRLQTAISLDAEQAATPTRQTVDLCEDEHAALVGQGLQSMTVVRLGTVDYDFGLVAVGRTEAAGLTPMHASSLQMMAAQVSMALHRIRLNRQRRDKAEALRASEARYRELYEHAPVAYVTVDGDGRIRMANEQAAMLLQTTIDTLRDRTLTHFCSSTDAADETTRRLTTCIREDERFYDQKVQLCRADGSAIWVSMSVQPLGPSSGETECLVTMRDVTEQVQMERALRDARDDLEHRVEARTEELKRTNEQLQEQTERLAILRDIDQAILAAESAEEIAAVAVRRAEQVVPCERVSVTLLDEEAGEAEILAAGSDETVLTTGSRVPLDEYYLPSQLRDGEPKRIADLREITLPAAAEKIRERGVRSVLCLPMMVEGELVGILKMGRTTPDAFTDADQEIGQELADHLAIALRQAQLWAAVQDQRARLEERVRERTAELQTANATLKEEIEERKRIEKALRESEERLSRIIDSAIDAIISIDADLNITLFNAAAEDIFQCAAGDATCSTLGPFLTDPFEALVRRHIDAHRTGSDDETAPGTDGGYLSAPDGLAARRADGETFPVEATLCPVELPDEDQYLLILRDLDELRAAEEEVDQLQSEKSYLEEEIKTEHNFDEIVGTSPPMQKVFDAIEQVADTDATVLVTGETGTGKELVARALHDRSDRADEVFVKVNCAALSSDLIESELFGHERGAFTGATEQREGRFELADGGTLLLDEIGELPLDTQAKLLRVLQHQEFERVGGSETITVDTRILAATNRDLEAEVDAGRFRSDLFYRLNIFPIELPPLRDRKSDIPLLAEHFCNLFCQRSNTTVTSISDEAMAALKAYDWPGNVRELGNIIERAVILTRDDEIRAEHLSIADEASSGRPDGFPTLEEAQRSHIENALQRTDGVVGGEDGAAHLLDMKRTTLLSRMDRLGIDPDDYR
jgi:PAS domain S-box-containing protein